MDQTSETVTVVALQALCEEIIESRASTKKLMDIAEDADKGTKDLEKKLTAYLEELKMGSFKFGGFNFIKTEKFSVTIPKGDNKAAFFDHLKSIGQFDALATVNSATLNAWYQQEKESSSEPIFMVPGIEIPTMRVGLTVRKST